MGQRHMISETYWELINDSKDEVPGDLIPMISGFLDRREKEVEELKKLMLTDDFIGVRYIGHRLKGTGGGFGLPVITEIGRQLESAAKDEDAEKIREFIQYLADVTALLRLSY
jgi:HPt (histidine-containing phosphotransfer) domain-containing protein